MAVLPLYAEIEANGKPNEFVFSEPFSETKNISNYLTTWYDIHGDQGIDDILQLPDASFSYSSDSIIQPEFPAVIWVKIHLTNRSRFDVPAALTFCHLADSIELYEVENDVVKYHAKTGSAYLPAAKPVPSVNNNLEIYLQAGQTHTFYIRNIFITPVSAMHLAELHIKDPSMMTAELMFRYVGQAFYAGLMLMFALLSFFSWRLLRDRSFLYFSLVHLAFTLYFLTINNVFGVLIWHLREFWIFNLEDVSISLLIISLFVFIAHYIRLRQRNPKAHRIMLFITIVVVLNKYIHHLFSDNHYQLTITNNLFILFWLIAIVSTIASLAHKRISEAVNLLISLSILVITAAVYLLALSRIIPQNFFTIQSIQIGSVLFALLVFYRLFEEVRSIENEKQRVLTISDLKSKFFTNVSHEFRTPLTLILSPLEKLNDTADNDQQRTLIKTAEKHANRLLHLINQLLDIARLEEGEMKLAVQRIDIVPYAKGILMSFESLAVNKEVELNFKSSSSAISLWLDSEKTETILYNLLSNALKHTSAGGSVSVEVIERNETVQIKVKDTGSGIPAEMLPYVFDRFFRVENTGAEGNGVGLCLANELTLLHKGHISVKSQHGKGSEFTLELRKGNSHFEPEEIKRTGIVENGHIDAGLPIEDDELLSPSADSAVFASNAQGKRPAVLLAEDNTDVRAFIRSQLIDRFEVLEAVNGRVGFEMALNHMPELIISDVMMPEMNGIEFCNLIKQDVRTSHIPVILLTAKTEQAHRLEGIEAGADDYLPKPFNVKELNVRVQKLIELRVRLRNRLMEAPALSYTPLDGCPVENQFVEQVTTCIHDHLADPGFSVSMLAEHVKLSEPQLNRKLKAITGISSGKYIQTIRLKKALLLLETENVNVSEAAFKTGFGSTAYFVKSFREQFGKTPGSILRGE